MPLIRGEKYLKSMKDKKVLIAMSGGVDSSTTAALLKEQGWYCEGAFIITHDATEQAQADVRAVGEKLGIKVHILDWREKFKKVLDYFLNEYKAARTPNPCVFCNRNIKFAGLYEFAKKLSLDCIATGHYVRIIEHGDEWGLYSAANDQKDQSYALAMIDRNILPFVMFPLGDKTKPQTREIAARLGLVVADKPDSQEICFIPDNDYAAMLERLCPAIKTEGEIVDIHGKKIGGHNGIYKYTIGQRKGLKVAMGIPYYVVSLDAEKNKVVLGPKENVYSKKLSAFGINWLCEKITQPFEAVVKIRYNHKGAPAVVYPQENNGVIIEFAEKVSAITPGQTAVFYRRDDYGLRLLGGAWIEKAIE